MSSDPDSIPAQKGPRAAPASAAPAGVAPTLGQCVTLACILEATAPKPGNVHRGADFEDVAYPEFLVSAVALGSVFARAREQRLGCTVLAAIESSQSWVRSNTYLGTVLLLAPLARVPADKPLASGVKEVLQTLDAQDAAHVYQAIRSASPGGLGNRESMDVAGPAPPDLITAMQAAADHDLVARQYTNGFHDVLEAVVPWLQAALSDGRTLPQAIVRTQLRVLAAYPDSLIERKCGKVTAQRASQLAARTLEASAVSDVLFGQALSDLDFWMRSDGHRRNPGTTADLIAAGIFAGLRDGWLAPPFHF